jgi:two-component system, cell cycle sensor histidine kinase and response regulator CckA
LGGALPSGSMSHSKRVAPKKGGRPRTPQPSAPALILQENDPTFRILFMNNPQSMWVYDLKTLQFLEVNQAAAHRYGYSREEFLAMRITDIRPAEDIPRLMDDLSQNHTALQYAGQWRHTLKSGKVIDVDITSHTLKFGGRDAELVVVQDVTDRNRAEHALRESEERYRELIQGVRDYAICMLSPSGHVISWNQGAERIKGYTAQEIIGSHFSRFYPPEDVQSGVPERALQQAVALGRHEREGWRVRKDGSRFIANVVLTAVRDHNGVLHGFSKITRDITDRKRADEALKYAEQKYRQIFEDAIIGIFQSTPDGRLLSANPAMAHLYGYASPEEMMVTVSDVRAQLYVDPKRRDDFKRAMQEQGVVRHFELEVYRKDGKKMWLSVNARAVKIGGVVVRYEGTFEDISNRKLLEEQLGQAEIKYRGIFENAVIGMFQSTTDGRYVTANAAMAKMLGYSSPEELISSITDIGTQVYVDPDRRQEFAELIERDGVVQHFELQAYRKDGSKMWLSASVRAVIKDGVTIGYEGMNEDISERKMLEDQLRQAQKMEAVGRLAGGVAHDFNNALAVITGYGDLLQLQLTSNDPLRKHAEEIAKAGRRAAALTRQLLGFSRKQVISPVVLDLNSVISELENMLRRLIGEDIEVSFKRESGLWRAKIDPGQVEQILMNLAVNARDAMPMGGRLCIETANADLDETYARQNAYVRPGPYVMLGVSDTGSGMDKHTQAHIFEPFFTTKDAGKGTGLGLSTVYGIVKQNDGYIQVYSEIGKGATFKIYFPRVREAAQTPQAVQIQSLPGGMETILLVEDEEPLRKLARTCLESRGYYVLEAAEAESALEVAQKHSGNLDLLLTDVVLPGVSGRELADRLEELRPSLKVLYMSGYTGDLVARHGVLDPGILLLEKPFTLHSLLGKVHQALHGVPEGMSAGAGF